MLDFKSYFFSLDNLLSVNENDQFWQIPTVRLFQIEPIKTVEIRFDEIVKIGAKILHTVISVNFLRNVTIISTTFR